MILAAAFLPPCHATAWHVRLHPHAQEAAVAASRSVEPYHRGSPFRGTGVRPVAAAAARGGAAAPGSRQDPPPASRPRGCRRPRLTGTIPPYPFPPASILLLTLGRSGSVQHSSQWGHRLPCVRI